MSDALETINDEIEEIETLDPNDYDPEVRVLAKFLGVELDDIRIDYDNDIYKYGKQEYLVLTDNAANTRAKDYLDSSLDDFLHDVPDQVRYYFDEDKWKEDAIASDGRGSILSSYDGNEDEEKDEITGEYYYIYRVN